MHNHITIRRRACTAEVIRNGHILYIIDVHTYELRGSHGLGFAARPPHPNATGCELRLAKNEIMQTRILSQLDKRHGI